jgi:hypothetical protein
VTNATVLCTQVNFSHLVIEQFIYDNISELKLGVKCEKLLRYMTHSTRTKVGDFTRTMLIPYFDTNMGGIMHLSIRVNFYQATLHHISRNSILQDINLMSYNTKHEQCMCRGTHTKHI